MSQPLQGIAEDEQERQYGVADPINDQEFMGKGNGHVIPRQEKGGKAVTEADIDDADENGKGNGDHTALKDALSDAVGFVCSMVLAYVSRHGDAEAHQGQDAQVIQFQGSRIGGDFRGAQGIQGKLNDDSAQGNDGGLEPHGQPQSEMQLPVLCGAFEMADTDAQDGHLPFDIKDTEDAGKELCHDGGDACPFCAHADAKDEGIVQHDIQDAGDDQEDQGAEAVPNGTHDVAHQIEQHGGDCAADNENKIPIGIFVNFRRGTQQCQQGAGRQNAHHSQQNGEDDADEAGNGKAALHSFFILGPKALGCHDGHAGGGPCGKAQDQEGEAAGAANGCQSVAAQGAPHDEGVCHIIKLLEQVPDEQGNGEI